MTTWTQRPSEQPTEEVKGNYWWLKLKETIVEGDILIAMVTALENEYD